MKHSAASYGIRAIIAIAAALVLGGPARAEQDSPMITVLPGCPVVIASVDVVPAAPTSTGVRQFDIEAMLGGTSKSTAAYVGSVAYVIYDESGPRPFFGSMNPVPMFMNIDIFMKFAFAEFQENYRHHIVGKPVAAVFLSCTKVPDALFNLQQKKFTAH